MTPIKEGSENKSGIDDAVVKYHKAAFNSIADEYICPLMLELPVDPVTAADGRIYERSEIEVVIKRAQRDGVELRSPVTNEPMGTQLLPAVQARNTIEKLVKTGVLDGDKARKWEERIADETYIASLKEKAEGGDVASMYRLGEHYEDFVNCLDNDNDKAYEWYRKASDKNYPPGMATAGECLIFGFGVEKNEGEGMFLMTMAAMYDGGSAYAALKLGMWYNSDSVCDIPNDKDRAKFFLRMVADGSRKYKDGIDSHDVDAAKDVLEKLTNDDN